MGSDVQSSGGGVHRARLSGSSTSSPGTSLTRMLFATMAFAFMCLCYYAVASTSNFGSAPQTSGATGLSTSRRKSNNQNLFVLAKPVTPSEKRTGDDTAANSEEDIDIPEELVVQPSKEEWSMKQDFYTSEFEAGDMSTTIIFNVFKGEPKALEMQLEAAAQQQNLSSVLDVWVMCFNSPRQNEYEEVVEKFQEDGTLPNLVFTVSNFNHKFHGRFLLAYMATTKYVLIVDDDKMIDDTTVYDYIQYMNERPGVWGNFGHLRAPTFDGYKSWPNVGYDTSVQDFAEQDYLSGMWFVQQSWLEYFVKERPPTWDTSEDMHLSHVMRKYLNLNTYGGRVAMNAEKLPSKKHAATVGSALDLREYVFDHQLGRGNKVANVVAPLRTLVYAETVEDIEDFAAKLQSCPTARDSEGGGQNNLRTGDDSTNNGNDMSQLNDVPPPWCTAGKTAVIFRGAAEQDIARMIQAAEQLCNLTECEYLSLKPKIQHPIRYFNMREGYGQSGTDIPWQTSVSDMLMSLVGVLNNILPQQFFFPDIDNVVWREQEEDHATKKNRLQIYHNAVRLALQIHANSKTNHKWDNRDLATDLETAYPTSMRVFAWRKSPLDVVAAEGEEDSDDAQALFQEFSFDELARSPHRRVGELHTHRDSQVKHKHQARQKQARSSMGGVDKYPYPKATWSPAGGWWHETKNWRGKTGSALVVMTLAVLPLALYSRQNHVKFPSEERRKLASHTSHSE